MTPELKEFNETIWKTRGARFNAYRRLRAKHRWSTWSIAFLSFYTLAINILPYAPIYLMNDRQKNLIAFFSLMLSLFILILSLLEGQNDYHLQASRLLSSANEMSDLHNRTRLISNESNTRSELKKYISEYSFILNKYYENHDPIDFEMFKTEHPDVKEFKMTPQKIALINTKYYIESFWIYYLTACFFPILTSLIIFIR